MAGKQRAARNRTITLSPEERLVYSPLLVKEVYPGMSLLNKIINGDIQTMARYIPEGTVDLLFLDPPYNLNKQFNNHTFSKMASHEYARWMKAWFQPLLRTLKPTASIYVCGDWRSSSAVFEVLSEYALVQNRITWEREKGRGAKANWKNASEDIWFATLSKDYYFNVEAVKLKRKVIAPYRTGDGRPKDWDETEAGNYRLTYPSNLWTDITVPFWSMPENTDHPTQKPEKLLAKIILASTRPGDIVFDPFAGSGTTAVVAKKLNRNFYAIEIDEEYCCLAQKRLAMAAKDNSIQGYSDGVFWERNTLAEQKSETGLKKQAKKGIPGRSPEKTLTSQLAYFID